MDLTQLIKRIQKLSPSEGDIIVCYVNGELTPKMLQHLQEKMRVLAEGKPYDFLVVMSPPFTHAEILKAEELSERGQNAEESTG